MRTMTGTWNCVESSKAWRSTGLALVREVGSSSGTSAAAASGLESSSFCEPQPPGSSPTRMTKPPSPAARLLTISESSATFSPTLFKQRRLRTPASEAPNAVSKADFSLMAHSMHRSSPAEGNRASTTLVLGDPG